MSQRHHKTTQNIHRTSKPRITKLHKHRRSHPQQNENHNHSSTVKTVLGNINNRAGKNIDDRSKANPSLFLASPSTRKSKSETTSIDVQQNNSRSDLLPLQSNRRQLQKNNDSKVQQRSQSVKIGNKTFNNKHHRYTFNDLHLDQNVNHRNKQINKQNENKRLDRSLNSINMQIEFGDDSNKRNQKRKKTSFNKCACSRLCIYFSIIGAILLATALAAGLIARFAVSKTTTTTKVSISTDSTTTTTTTVTTETTTTTTTTETTTTTTTTDTTTTTTTTDTTTTTTTTDTTTTTTTTTTTDTTTTTTTTDTTTTTTTTDTTTTTTTETTTITYVPTGIYALNIPPCATWNRTGITVAGNQYGTAGNDSSSLDTPVSIFIDNNYTLYVCDRVNDRIVKYNVNTTVGIVVAGNGTPGNSPEQLYEPKGVAVDQMGAIIVADSLNYRIQRFPLGSIIGTTIAINSSTNSLGQLRDLHIDVNNGVYVTDSDYNRVVKYYPNNGIGVILAGINGTGSAANQFLVPFGNFIDGNQSLYVADRGNHRIQKWSKGATSGITVAGVTGVANSSLSYLNKPVAVIVDNNGYTYIVDSGNNRIVRWTNNYGAGGTCIVGCTGTTGNAANQLNGPRDLKFDASGNLYVSDQGNNRIQKFMLELPPNCSATG